MVTLRTRFNLPGWAEIFVPNRFYAVAFAVCCITQAFIPEDSFADDTPTNSFQVKEEETQLAKRFAERESVEPLFEYSLGAGYRKDNLNWNIAVGGVNVASEVSWKGAVIAQLRAAGKVNLGGDWLVRGMYITGAVWSGGNQDSDYAGNNRTQEYSRSNNKTGGTVHDISIGIGKKIRLFDLASGRVMYVVPLAGYSIHQQNMTMYDGRQTIPAYGALSGLQNTYDTRWKGAWLGMDALLGLGKNISLNATLEYHRVDYSAEANWNLRNDFAHPVSFRHFAKGNGILANIGASYGFSRNFSMNASFEKQKWKTHSGYDQTNLSYGATNYYTLNPVSWDSTSLFLAAVYRF